MSNIGKTIRIDVSPRFRFFLRFPEGALGNFVSTIWASDGVPPFRQERIIPNVTNVLLFNFGDPLTVGHEKATFLFKKTLFSGVFSHFNNVNYGAVPARHTQAGVIFKPGGAYPFIREPIVGFKNTAAESLAFGDRYFEHVHERIGQFSEPEDRIAHLERLLLNRLKQNAEENPAQQLIGLIRRHPEKNIEQITRKTGYSQQHFNRLLGKFAGTNAKAIQKIFRLNQAMQTMQQVGSAENLTGISYDAGYFDQAHFIHDFREMTGMTPKEYLRIRHPDPNRVLYLH